MRSSDSAYFLSLSLSVCLYAVYLVMCGTANKGIDMYIYIYTERDERGRGISINIYVHHSYMCGYIPSQVRFLLFALLIYTYYSLYSRCHFDLAHTAHARSLIIV